MIPDFRPNPVTGAMEKPPCPAWNITYAPDSVALSDFKTAVDPEKMIRDHAKWLQHDTKAGKRATFFGAQLRKVNLSGANLRFAYFYHCDFTAANLANTNLQRAVLTNCTLDDANMAYAFCPEAQLDRANLRGANLEYANLKGTNLSESDLKDANLWGANLLDAILTKSNLWGTKLGFANLEGTCLEKDYVDKYTKFCKACPLVADGSGRIVYRTQKSINTMMEYIPGNTYVAEDFSFSETPCHPGIYAGTLERIKFLFPIHRIVECFVKEGEYVFVPKGDGLIRAKVLQVLREITRSWNES